MTDGAFEGLDFFTDPSLAADPYPYYGWLHECPVRRESTHGVVLVSGYDEAVSVWRDDKETFSACNVVSGPFPGLPVPPEGDDISQVIAQYRDTLPLHEFFASFDPPTHTDHRWLLMRLLTPKRLQENEAFLWQLADQQIDTFADQGNCEFVRAFGNPFTMLAIADLLGVPEEDRGRFGRADQLIGNLESETFEPASIQHMEQWFVEYVEERRREPRDDVLTHMALGTFPDGSTPDAVDVARVATFLFAAGQGTTVDLLSSALVMLAERPELQQLLRADPARIPVFVEEMLRYESPIKSNFRLVARSTRLGDVELPAGTNVLVMNGAANRDPRRFEDANDFRLDRPNVGEHLAFGRGIHACPGAPLARAEARIALERILDRVRDIRINEEQHGPPEDRRYEWEPTFLLRRLRALHLEFAPAPLPRASEEPHIMSAATTPTGPLSQKVLEFAEIIERTVPAAKDAAFTDAAWAPLASLVVADEFERIGIWREVMNWEEYVTFLTKFASAKGFESAVRRITEMSNVVFYEIEEHHIKDGKVNIVNSMNVFEFDDEAKIRRLDVYIQGIVEPSVPVQRVQ